MILSSQILEFSIAPQLSAQKGITFVCNAWVFTSIRKRSILKFRKFPNDGHWSSNAIFAWRFYVNAICFFDAATRVCNREKESFPFLGAG